MKINRFIALALIALLVVGAMGLLSYQALAQRNASQTTQDCNSEDNDANEPAETEDTDEVEEECGVQAEDEGDEADNANEVTESGGQDESDETAPANTDITADEAQAIVEAANPGASTLGVEFDRESGKDLWEVELDNGQDVKVDASTGEILYSEQRD